ncbi:hypothetical protein ACWNYO_00735 [Candidatus Vidania fulgoroideorum]
MIILKNFLKNTFSYKTLKNKYITLIFCKTINKKQIKKIIFFIYGTCKKIRTVNFKNKKKAYIRI